MFGPTANGMPADAIPDVTPIPFTVTVAFGSVVVGVMVTVATEKGSLTL